MCASRWLTHQALSAEGWSRRPSHMRHSASMRCIASVLVHHADAHREPPLCPFAVTLRL